MGDLEGPFESVCGAWECRFSPNRKKRFAISHRLWQFLRSFSVYPAIGLNLIGEIVKRAVHK